MPKKKRLFVAFSWLNAQPLRIGQYYLNKDAFDKKEDVPGIYELSDLPYTKKQKVPKKYHPKKAAVGKGRSHLLDIESPTPLEGKRLEKLPVIVCVHGGAYLTNNKECNRPHSQWLAAKGFKVVNINYTLQPEATLYGEMKDLNDVFAWIGENAKKYGFDTNNVFLTGDSSGGHLSLLYTGLRTRKDMQKKINVKPAGPDIRATAVTCPVGSFVADDIISKVFRNLAGRLYDKDEKLLFSYEGFMDETYPEVAIITTETDVPIHTATKGIHNYMEAKGIAHEYKVFEGKEHKLGHVFNILHPDWEESIEANEFLADFFARKKK